MSQSPVSILAPAAFASALDVLAKDYEPGLVSVAYGPAAGPAPDGITSRLQAGASCDFVILPHVLAQAELSAGRLVGSPVQIFASTVAFCVPEGSERPDLSTEAGLWRALADAPSIGLSAAGSGKFFHDVLVPRSGQGSALEEKLRIIADRPVGNAVAEGFVALGFQQKAELLEAKGIELIDDLTEIARNDTWLVLAQCSGSAAAATKLPLVEHILSEHGRRILTAHGLLPAP